MTADFYRFFCVFVKTEFIQPVFSEEFDKEKIEDFEIMVWGRLVCAVW